MKIAIASGKGGTGKTFLATNLASFLAETERVLLCDLDVEEPNDALFINGKIVAQQPVQVMVPRWEEDKCTGCDLCRDVCAFHALAKLGSDILVFPQLCHGCYACSELCPDHALPMVPLTTGMVTHSHSSMLHLVEGKLDIGQEQAVPVIRQTKAYAQTACDGLAYVLFDAPPGTSCPVVEATRDADLVLLVTEPTPFGLHDLKLAVETMRSMGRPVCVVINRVGLGNDEVVCYCRDNAIPVIAEIPDSRFIAERYAKGFLVYRHLPEVRRQLERIHDHLKTFNFSIDQ